MYRRALLSIIVYLMFNLATSYASSDPIEEQKIAELEKCVKDLATIGGKDKKCNNVSDFEALKQSFKDYFFKKYGNKTINENLEYIEIITTSLSDKRFPNATKNEDCVNKTALDNCRKKQYEAPEEISLMKKFFSKNHNISPTRSACSDSRQINACTLKNAINHCDNATISLLKGIMDKTEKRCLDIVEDSNTESPSDNKDGAARCLQTILRSISMAFFVVLLL